MPEPLRYAVFDVETRCLASLARKVLGLGAEVPDGEVAKRLLEKRRAETKGSDFLKLPYHEPIAAAILLVERASRGADEPLVATDWRSWKLGDLPVEQFVERFFAHVAGRALVGFNSLAFDLPLLELWASRCRIAIPGRSGQGRSSGPRDGRGADRHCDVQKVLVSWATGSGSLDELCKFHGLPGKPGVSGDEVQAMADQGRVDEIHAYNVTDVVQTYLLFLHLEVRAGRLSAKSAAKSAVSAIELAREKVLLRLAEGGAARGLLERSLAACAAAPIAQP